MTWTLTRRNLLSLPLLLGSGFELMFPLAGKAKTSLASGLGIITDEITDDFEKALDFISSHSLAYCEIRQLWQKNVFKLSPEELERARQLIVKHRLKVAAIGSPIFKYHVPGMPSPYADMSDTFMASDLTDKDTEALLNKACKLARFFGTSKVRIFSYWRTEDPEKAFPFVRDRLAKAADFAGRQNITLLLENEHECNVGTGKELARMIRAVGPARLHGLWDPGNAFRLGEVPYPDGYNKVRGLFRHMHIKDARKDPATGKAVSVIVGEGAIDYRGQFAALQRDGYDGTISLETSYSRPDGNKVESTRECLEGLLRVLRSVNA